MDFLSTYVFNYIQTTTKSLDKLAELIQIN